MAGLMLKLKLMAGAVRSYVVFRASLLSDIVVSRGTGPLTFTRATAQTYVDGSGVLRSVASDSPAYDGLRGITNLLTYTEDFSNAAWTAFTPSSSATADTITFTGVGNDFRYQSGISVIAGKSYRVHIDLKRGSKSSIAIQFSGVSFTNGFKVVTLTDSWVRYSYLAVCNASGSANIGIDNRIAQGGDGVAGTVMCRNIQIEDVTGLSNQNPSEYSPNLAATISTIFKDYANPNTVDGNGVVTDSGVRTPVYTSLGIKLEPVSTNLFLNSAVGVTQNITTTAIPFTLSFYGTGTITKSGTATGALVGTGANNSVSQTFTPTAGTLTLTVTGSCTNVQCEALPYITSPILTAGAAATRNATVLTGPLTANLPSGTKHISLYFSTAGYLAGSKQYLGSSRTDANNEVSIWHNGVIVALEKKVAGVSEYVTYDLTPVIGTEYLVDAYIYADNTMGLAINGTLQSGTLGAELITQPLDISSGWTASNSTINSGTQFTNTATTGSVFKNAPNIWTAFKIYTATLGGSVSAGTISFRTAGSEVLFNGFGTNSFIAPSTNRPMILNSAGGIGAVTSGLTLSTKQVLNNSTTLAPVFASTFEVGSSASLNQLNGNLNSLKIYSR